MKKLLSVLLAAALVLGLGVPALAAEASEPVAVTLLVNGTELDLGENSAVIYRNRTVAPLEPLAEALGLTVKEMLPNGKITLTRDRTTIHMTLNSTAFDYGRPGASGNAALEIPPRRINGEIYVPVYAIARALGLENAWNQELGAVSLLDKDALISGIDESFTLVNGVLNLGKGIDLSQTWRSDVHTDVTLVLGEGDDAVFLSLGAKGTGLVNDRLVWVDVAYETESLAEMFAASGAVNEQSAALLLAMQNGVRCIYDQKSGVMYMQGAILDMFFAAATGAGTTGTWYTMDINALTASVGTLDLSGIDLAALAAHRTTTVGELVYLIATVIGATAGDAMTGHTTVPVILGALSSVSDSAFTRVGDDYVLSREIPSVGSVDLTVHTADTAVTGCDGVVAADMGGMGLYADASMTATQVEMLLSLDIPSVLSAALTLESTVSPAPDAVLPALPAAEDTVSLDALFGLLMTAPQASVLSLGA